MCRETEASTKKIH